MGNLEQNTSILNHDQIERWHKNGEAPSVLCWCQLVLFVPHRTMTVLRMNLKTRLLQLLGTRCGSSSHISLWC